MAFTMSYDMKLPAAPKKPAAATAAPPAKKTGRAARANSPQAKAEALFERPVGSGEAAAEPTDKPTD